MNIQEDLLGTSNNSPLINRVSAYLLHMLVILTALTITNRLALTIVAFNPVTICRRGKCHSCAVFVVSWALGPLTRRRLRNV